jgi:hypothetical protein
MHVLRVDQVVIVHHQHHVLRRFGQVVDQRRDGRHERGRRRVGDQETRPFGHPRARPAHGGGDVAPEPHGIVVALVQRQPGDGSPVNPHPLGEQRRLAEPRRRADQHELAPGRGPQPLQQPGAAHSTSPQPRHGRLRRQQQVTLGTRRLHVDHSDRFPQIRNRALAFARCGPDRSVPPAIPPWHDGRSQLDS